MARAGRARDARQARRVARLLRWTGLGYDEIAARTGYSRRQVERVWDRMARAWPARPYSAYLPDPRLRALFVFVRRHLRPAGVREPAYRFLGFLMEHAGEGAPALARRVRERYGVEVSGRALAGLLEHLGVPVPDRRARARARHLSAVEQRLREGAPLNARALARDRALFSWVLENYGSYEAFLRSELDLSLESVDLRRSKAERLQARERDRRRIRQKLARGAYPPEKAARMEAVLAWLARGHTAGGPGASERHLRTLARLLEEGAPLHHAALQRTQRGLFQWAVRVHGSFPAFVERVLDLPPEALNQALPAHARARALQRAYFRITRKLREGRYPPGQAAFMEKVKAWAWKAYTRERGALRVRSEQDAVRQTLALLASGEGFGRRARALVPGLDAWIRRWHGTPERFLEEAVGISPPAADPATPPARRAVALRADIARAARALAESAPGHRREARALRLAVLDWLLEALVRARVSANGLQHHRLSTDARHLWGASHPPARALLAARAARLQARASEQGEPLAVQNGFCLLGKILQA